MHGNTYICTYGFNKEVHNYSKALLTVFHKALQKN